MSSLPVLQPKRTIRPSRSSKRRAAVLVLVHLLIAAHVTHWLVAGRTVTPVEPSEAAAFSRLGVVNAGLIFFAVTILLTAVFGRFFCGWACHLVALQDLCRSLLARFGRKPKPLRSRLLRWVPAVAFVYAFLWPLAYRLWAGGSLFHVETEFTTSEFWATFPGWMVGGLTFLVCGFVAVFFLGAKGFCTYACPYGAIFGLAEKASPLRVRVTDACEGCGHCTAVCSSNVRVHEEVRDYGMVVDSGCMRCLDCVSVCPNDALYYGAGPLPLFAKPRAAGRKMTRYPLGRREEAVLAIGFVAAFFAFRGLYGAVPFLLALGLAAVLAYGLLLTYQLATRPHLALKGWRLKRHGRLLPAGRWFLVAMALVLALWGHSAAVRSQEYLGERGFYRTARGRLAALDPAASSPALDAAERRTAERALERLRRAERWGLVPASGMSYRLAWLERLAGTPGAMAERAHAAIARGERPVEMRQLLALTARERGDRLKAAEEYELALAAEPPRDERVFLALGITHAERGDLRSAAAAFGRGLERFPRSAELAYNAALVRALGGDAPGAIAGFERALELAPEHLPARENLAGMLASVGRYEESLSHYRRALSQSPGDARTRLLTARVLLALGRFGEAEEELRESLRLEPGRVEARELLAGLAAGSGGEN